MVLEKIEIKNFRNLDSIIYYPGTNINFIVGDNAQGKTNLIEAIYFLSYGKSFRTNKLNNLFNKINFFNIEITVRNNNVKSLLNIKVSGIEKVIKVNNKIKRIKDISDKLKVILYFPSEISILLKSPALRRNLIDKSIFLHDVNYLDMHLDYIKCLKNRNICLKNCKDDYIWKEQLIDLSYEITKKRIDYIKNINNIFIDNENIVNDELYKIKYKNIDLINYKTIMRNDFEKVKINEKKFGYTIIGQHTDNIIFQINEKNIENFGSEGQKKTFLLLYKYSQLMNFYHHKNFKPLLLIDDISSEIDHSRQKILINKLLSNCEQSFITSLSKPTFYNEKAEFFYINNGKLMSNKEIS